MKTKKFINKAQFPGGRIALIEFVKENLVYPQAALKKRIEGKVLIKYEVNEKGIVHSIKIVNGLGHGCDEEAIRLVQLLRYPEVKNRGLKVNTKFKISIQFKLPSSNSIKINYTLVDK